MGRATGTVEMTLGAALHTMRVPLRGAALCSIQAAMLTFASARLSPPGRVAWVSFISAGLKAFSPSGGRVRPMVAITIQGSLYSFAVQLLGWNFLSVTLGGAGIGAWAALQGFFLQYLLPGDELTTAYGKVVHWLAENWQLHAPSMQVLLAAWTVLHALAASGAALFAWHLRAPARHPCCATNSHLQGKAAGRPCAMDSRVTREFPRWHFWVPLVAAFAVLLASGRTWETVMWIAVRFIAVSLVLFAVLSLFKPAAFLRRLRRLGWWGPAAAFGEALSRLR